jgi:manganese/zinc/iron transport system permease protein
VLVVALMVGPPAAAYLLTDRLSALLGLSVLLGTVAAALGLGLANWLDASIAGCMAVGVGFVFLVVYLVAPGRGLLAELRRRRRQRWSFAEVMLTIHLLQHAGQPEEDDEARIDHLHGKHVGWTPEFTRIVVAGAVRRGFVVRDGERLRLTEDGRVTAGRALSGTG